MGSDAGAGWQGDVTSPDEPPPTPFERAPVPVPGGPRAPVAAEARDAPRRRRLGRAALLVAVAVALAAAGALVLDGRPDASAGGEVTGASAADAAATDAALLDLLGAVDASELAMLGFDEASLAAFEEAASADEALELIRLAAEDAVAELRSGRARLDESLRAAAAEEVRAAYVPHLDAWVAYLQAIAADPEVLFGAEQEALVLRINATAAVFVAALERTVAAGVGPEVEAAARAILERGFPDEEDAEV